MKSKTFIARKGGVNFGAWVRRDRHSWLSVGIIWNYYEWIAHFSIFGIEIGCEWIFNQSKEGLNGGWHYEIEKSPNS